MATKVLWPWVSVTSSKRVVTSIVDTAMLAQVQKEKRRMSFMRRFFISFWC